MTVPGESHADVIAKSPSDSSQNTSHSGFSVEWPIVVHLRLIIRQMNDIIFQLALMTITCDTSKNIIMVTF